MLPNHASTFHSESPNRAEAVTAVAQQFLLLESRLGQRQQNSRIEGDGLSTIEERLALLLQVRSYRVALTILLSLDSVDDDYPFCTWNSCGVTSKSTETLSLSHLPPPPPLLGRNIFRVRWLSSCAWKTRQRARHLVEIGLRGRAISLLKYLRNGSNAVVPEAIHQGFEELRRRNWQRLS